MSVERAFVRLNEGLVHYRYAKAQDDASIHLPLYLVHAGPVSSASVSPLVEELSKSRDVYAPDTLGFGDSAPPAPEAPDLAYFADSVIRVLDELELEKVDYYGSHTGAHIGCELAIAHPDRVRRLIFDGIGLFDDELKDELLANYAPVKQPDEYGSQFAWAWQFLRDQALFFPYFKKDAQHRLDNPVLPPEQLHDFVLDVLKALTTYHKGYHAVFRHDTAQRLPMVNHPVLLMAMHWDPMKTYLEGAHSLAPDSRIALLGETDGFAEQASVIKNFLDEDD